MDTPELSDAERLLLRMVPEDGTAISNKALKEQFGIAALVHDKQVAVDQFEILRQSLLDKGMLVKGKGLHQHGQPGGVLPVLGLDQLAAPTHLTSQVVSRVRTHRLQQRAVGGLIADRLRHLRGAGRKQQGG